MYKQLKDKLENAHSVVWSDGAQVDEKWIEDAEGEIGIRLPPSYRWWLKEYGSATIGGSDIFTLAPPEFRDDADVDLVYMHRLNSKNQNYEAGRLYVYQPNTDEAYFFDLARPDSNEEYPVMRDDLISGGVEMYGSNFAEFLERLLDEHPL